jgi:hypothetical protein
MGRGLNLDELVQFIWPDDLKDLLRVEALDYYDSEGDHPQIDQWQAGEPVQLTDGWKGWLDGVRDRANLGITQRRVHVLTEPLSEYLRFELGVHYTANSAAGEQIRILTVPQLNRWEIPDIYVVNGERVAIMTYDLKGAFICATDVGEASSYWARSAEDLWQRAEPFEQWWAARPQYRDRQAA